MQVRFTGEKAWRQLGFEYSIAMNKKEDGMSYRHKWDFGFKREANQGRPGKRAEKREKEQGEQEKWLGHGLEDGCGGAR